MKELPLIEVIVCGAAHDEKACPKNFSLSFCKSNAICSHGNKIIEAAICRGKKMGKISPEKAAALDVLLYETGVKLQQWADCNANAKRHIRLHTLPSDDEKSLEAFLVLRLGPDRSRWEEVQGKGQLETAKPILETVRYLEELGLLRCSEEPTYVDVAAFIANNDKENPWTM